jgi:hypothetical protein
VLKPSLLPASRRFASIWYVSLIFTLGMVFGAFVAMQPNADHTVEVRVTSAPEQVSVPATYNIEPYRAASTLACHLHGNDFCTDRMLSYGSIEITPELYWSTYSAYNDCPLGSLHVIWDNESYCEPRLLRLSLSRW